MNPMRKTAAIAAVVALATAGLVSFGAGTAGAVPSLELSQSSGLVHNQQVDITVSGLTPSPLSAITISQCGNAYADNTPLPSVDTAYGSRDCEVLRFATSIASTTVTFDDVPIKQIDIGNGNRSCIVSGGPQPCVVHVSQSVNQGGVNPSVDVTYAADDPNGEPAATVTAVQLVGAPLAISKNVIAHVQVHRADDGVVPEGTFSIALDGGTPVNVAADHNGSASVQLAAGNTLPLGPHSLTATYNGNGSFAPSSDGPQSVSIVADRNITIGDATVIAGEEAGSERLVAFPVVLSRATPGPDPLEVHYRINGITAVPGVDYVELNKDVGKLKWNPLVPTAKYIIIKVMSNPGAGDKTFTVDLEAPPGGLTGGFVIRRGSATGTVKNITPAAGLPTVNIGDVTVPEGDLGGAKALKFSITLSEPAAEPFLAVLSVGNVTAVKGNKLTGDWGGGQTKRVRFNAGQVSKIVAVPTFPDLNSEIDETLTVDFVKVTQLTKVDFPAGTEPATGGDGRGIGTILSDE
jgi:hypothetical protein